jgi:hypothetical protein
MANVRRLIVFFVIIGFLISLYGRLEAESIFHSHFNDEGISGLKADDSTSPAGQSHPVGAHKDQHGCYHSHASLDLPTKVSPLSPVFSSTYLTEPTQPLFPTITFSITHPPRA